MGLLVLVAACAPRDHSPPPVHPLFGIEARTFLLSPLTIEVKPSAGRVPSQAALDLLVQRARERCVGPVTIVVDRVAPTSLSVWDQGDLQAFENQYRTVLGSGVVFVAWLGGRSANGGAVVGELWTPHSLAIYADGNGSRVGEALVHEFGHALGLVRTARMDRAHPYHDVDPRCVMYHLTNGATDFCNECRLDLVSTAMGRQ